MRILFIKQKGEDYLGDSIYHGLKSLYKVNVSCNVDLDYMYNDYVNKSSLYGKGFSLFCDLKWRWKNVESPDNIMENIQNKVYDYIFYGSVWRSLDYLDLVKQYYSNDKIVLFDGEDGSTLHPLVGQHAYFKREMVRKIDEFLYPINFSIPASKFVDNITDLEKIKDYGTVVPYKSETYIFNDEESYYKDYQESYFGVTMKKAGWDCMRHYEILANGCIPYFPEIENCPFYTMYNFPKELVKEANKLAYGFDEVKYYDILADIFKYSKENLTTEANINYVFNTLNKVYKKPKFGNPIIENEYDRLCSPQEGESIDIKEHLPTLCKYTDACVYPSGGHITEMGVRSVVSTWAFLQPAPARLICYDIEYHPNIEKALIAAKESNIQMDYILKDVLRTEIEETDFLFLDTWHVYDQVKQELAKHASKVRKYIGFHDTTSYEWSGEGQNMKGIWPAIQEFIGTHPEWILKERFTNNNGLTILERV